MLFADTASATWQKRFLVPLQRLIINDEVYERIVFGQEEREGRMRFEYCPDCAAPPGALHHLGCDWEQCPRCSGQLIGCQCRVEPVDEALSEEQARLQLTLPLVAEG